MPQSKHTLGIAIACAVGVMVIAGLLLLRQSPEHPSPSAKRPLIGGPFELVTHKGETVTHENFLGKPFLVFFGFTYCPDICPLKLDILGATLDAMGDDAELLQIAFITVDPERDTTQVMADYVAHFHPQILGLTGTPEQIATAAKTFGIYYRKVPQTGDSDDYLMDHSSYVYLLGPDGAYATHFTHLDSPEEFSSKLLVYLNNL